jgi:hypothetical protein
MKSMAILLCTSLLFSCTSTPPADRRNVAVIGDPAATGNLTGKWRGTFSTDDHAHDGSIEFEFAGGSKEGSGRIVLAQPSVELKMLWVRVSGNGIAGAIQPYHDPSCSCSVYSTFSGEFDAEGLHGEFRR